MQALLPGAGSSALPPNTPPLDSLQSSQNLLSGLLLSHLDGSPWAVQHFTHGTKAWLATTPALDAPPTLSAGQLWNQAQQTQQAK